MSDDLRDDGGRLLVVGLRARVATLGVWLLTAAGLAGLVGFLRYEADDGPAPSAASAEAPVGQVAREELDSIVWALAFSPDGSRLASATIGGRVRLRDLATGRSYPIQSGPTSSARWLSFSPDGRTLAVAGAQSVVRLWTPDTGEQAESARICGDTLKCAEFSPDGRSLAVGGNCGRIAVWDLDGLSPPRTLAVGPTCGRTYPREKGEQPPAPVGHRECVNSVAFSPDGSALATTDTNGSVRVWDLPSGRFRVSFRAHASGMRNAVFTPDGRRLVTAASLDPAVHVWDAATGAALADLPAFGPSANAISLTPGGALAVARMDGSISVFDRLSDPPRGSFQGFGSIYAVASSRDGRLLATGGGDSSLRIWDLNRMPAPAPPRLALNTPRG